MIIRKLRASFGCLENEELKLKEGLNIIEAANESGKSTWCAFLRCMLYGVDSSQRERGGVKPDKLRFAPWSGAPMEGEAELEYRGMSVTLRRGTKNPAAPLREFSATYTGTDEPAAFLRPTDAGEQLTGVTESVFERTAFIRQAGMGVGANPELEKRIASLLSSGEEDASYTEADERLRAWQRRRRFRNRGHLPELEGEIDDVRGRLAAIEKATRELGELEDMGESCRLRRDHLAERLERERRERRDEALRRLADMRAQMRKREEDAASQRDERARLRDSLDASRFAPAEPPAARQRAEREAREAERLRQQAAGRSLTWLWAGLLTLALAALALRFLPAAAGIAGWATVCAGALGVLAAGAALADWLLRRRRRKAGAACAALLADCGAASPEDVRAAAEEYGALWERCRAAEAAAEKLRLDAETLTKQQKDLEEKILGDALGGGEETGTAQALADAERELAGLRETCAMAKGRLDTLGDKLVLESRLESLEEQRALEERRYKALELALEALREANTELQNRFSPALAQRTAQLYARLTDGRYGEVTLDRELSAMLRRRGDTLPHESAFLSQGACDQLYLALRLALCEMALPGEEKCPLILDDALVSFDDARMALALELLRELARERQIILFTCQSREGKYIRAHAEKA